jgi:methyl-accepting chemotaxis protein
MSFKNMRVATKLWVGVGFIVLALVSLLTVASMRAATQQQQIDTTLADLNLRAKAANSWYGATLANSVRVTATVISSDPNVGATFKDNIAETTTSINELQKKIEGMQLSSDEKEQMAKIAAHRKNVISLRDASRQLRTEGKADEALASINSQYIPAQKLYLASLADLVQMEEKAVSTFMADMAQAKALTSKVIVGLVVLLLLAILAGAALLIKSIRVPLAYANELASRIAKGDLSVVVKVDRGDEFGDLMRSLAAMNESLGRMVHQVRQSTDSIATASSEIAQGNNDLAQRTEQTSSNLQATASSMNELTTAVQHSADSARQASTLAADASSVAEKGGAVVKQVVFTMEEINVSSKKIADIIGVIDGIAFQTNILALNAAVEAARAGEQGRGFAVVASEVRSLAQRSAEAAKEIKMLIGTSVDKVASGTKLVSDAGATMSDIVSSVRKVADVIGEITAASAEQSAGISHVNQSISTLDQMTQQNAALVEESAAAAESLRDQANQMAQAVAVFKISDSVVSGLSRPIRDITPAASNLTYNRPKALSTPRAAPALGSTRPASPAKKPLALAAARPVSTVKKPLAVAAPKKTAPAAPAVSQAAAADDWETF